MALDTEGAEAMVEATADTAVVAEGAMAAVEGATGAEAIVAEATGVTVAAEAATAVVGGAMAATADTAAATKNDWRAHHF